MAAADVSGKIKFPSSISALSPLGKGKIGFGLGAGIGGSAGLFMSAEDQRLSQQVQEKHAPDGRQVDVRPLLHLVEDIFARANANVKLGVDVEEKAGGAAEAHGRVRGNLGVGGGIGINTGAGAGANVAANAGAGDVSVAAGSGGHVSAGAGIGGGMNVGGGIGGNIGLGGGIGGCIGLGGEIGGNLGVGGGVDGKLGNGIGGNLGIGGSIGGGVGGKFDVGGGLEGKASGSTGAGVEASAGVEAGAGGKLGIGDGISCGLGGSLGVATGAGGGLGGKIGVRGDVGGDIGVEGGIGGSFDAHGDVDATFEGSPDLPFMIERVSCEMGCKGLGGIDPHNATFSVLDILSHYSWEAKMVITLAAFAANYGEFLLLSQVYSINPLAQSMALLKQIPSILQHEGDKMKSQMNAINGLINSMLNVTKLVVDFGELPSDYVKPEEPTVEVVHNHFPLAVYWTIRSAVAAATQIAMIATMGHQFMPSTIELELFNWSAKLKLIFDFLTKMKLAVQKIIDEKQEEEAYNKIRRIIFKMVHQDNMTVLKTLIYNKDDVLPLYDGSTKKRVQLDVLQGRMVLMLVTSLDISQDQLTMFENIYKESKTRPYNIVWVPIIDRSVTWNDSMQSQFENIQSTMSCYSVYHPSIIGNAVIRFFNKDLNFKGQPILVPLDAQGKITSMNAMHMMWIWKDNAFPFTSTREDFLWRQESWRLELLVDNIDETILNWGKEGKYIFIYGGDDLEWIKKFTKVAKDAAAGAKIDLEMVYVGKSNKTEVVRKNIDAIKAEKMSHHLKDITSSWFFWTRLEGMLQSLVQLEKVNDDDNNKVVQEIKKLISHDKNAGGWAILAKGSELVLSVQGSIINDVLSRFDEWKKRIDELGGAFHIAIQEKVKDAGPDHVSCRFEFPTEAGKIPHEMICPECHRKMKNYFTFACNHDGVFGGGFYLGLGVELGKLENVNNKVDPAAYGESIYLRG